MEARRSARALRSHGRPASAARATRASPAYVQRINGAIGYVEYAYAKQNKMTYAQMQNRDGSSSRPIDGDLQGRRRRRRLGQGARLST